MRILAVDLAGIFHRAWHASANKDLDHSQRWTLERVRRLADEYDSVVIALEGHGPTWRRERFSGYKANRPERDERLIEQLRQTEEACEREGWHCVRRDGMEADDIISTVAARFGEAQHDTDILSDDKDFCQCVDSFTRLLRGEGAAPHGATWVKEKTGGIGPDRFIQWQALCGDTADNIPGVKGVGPKTATRLLLEFGNLANIIGEAHRDPTGSMTPKERDAWREENPNAVCGKLAENLKLSVSSGELGLSLALVTLKTDALTPKECEALLEPKAIETETAEDFVEGDIMDRESITEQLEAAEVEVVPEPTPSAPEPSQPRAMVKAEPNGNGRGLQPSTLDEVARFAKWVMDSRMFSSYGTAQAVALAVIKGDELGIKAMASLDSIYIVEGKPSLSAQVIKGLCHRSPECEYFRMVSITEEAATFETLRRGEPEPTQWTYSLKDAEKAGLTNKKNWRSYPKPMMANRCMAELARFVYPDVVANLYTADELGSDNYEEAA